MWNLKCSVNEWFRLSQVCVVLLILMTLTGCAVSHSNKAIQSISETQNWQSLFDGQTLNGWTVKAQQADKDKTFFWVEDGVIVAEATDKDHDYVWLYSDKQYTDFHLKLKFQGERGDHANSGVQVRSRYDHNDEGGWLNGPQIDVGFTDRNGSMWDETRNNQRWLLEQYTQAPFFYSDEGTGWNELDVIVRGNLITVIQNGQEIGRYDGTGVLNDDNHQDLAVGTIGHIALQIHKEDIMKIKFKDIQIKDLSPTAQPLRVLVFSKTTGYFHQSINVIEETIAELGERHGWAVDITRGAEIFTPEGLAKYDVVFWNNTCADYAILTAEQRLAYQRYVENGGGYAGIHGAAWMNFTPRWDWYIDELIGAREINKNGNWEGVWREEASIYADIKTPVTAMVPKDTIWKDEFYSMSRDVRADQPELSPEDQIEVLTSAIADWDYGDFRSGHPVTWRRNIKGGRMWYSAIGHNDSTITDPVFREHMKAGIEWAAGKLN